MTQLKLIQIATALVEEGETNDEIRKALFNTKGARLAQIRKVMALIA